MPCALQRVKILQLLLWPAEEKRLAGHKKQKFKKKKSFRSLQPIMEYIQAICNLNTYTLHKI